MTTEVNRSRGISRPYAALSYHNMLKHESAEFDFPRFTAIYAAGARVHKLFRDSHDGVSTDSFFSRPEIIQGIIYDCGSYQQVTVTAEQAIKTIQIISTAVDIFNPSENLRESILQKVWNNALTGVSDSEKFFGKMKQRIFMSEFSAQKKEVGYAASANDYGLPEDHLSILGTEESGYSLIEEGLNFNDMVGQQQETRAIQKIEQALLKLPSEQQRTIIRNLYLGNGKRYDKEESQAVEAFRQVWMKNTYTRVSLSEKNTIAASLTKTRAQKELSRIAQEVGSLQNFFSLIDNANLSHEQRTVILYYSGYFHSYEQAPIFAINERTSITLLIKTFNISVQALQAARSFSRRDRPEVCIRDLIEQEEQISSTKRKKFGIDRRLSVPETLEEKITALSTILHLDSAEIKKLTHPHQRAVAELLLTKNTYSGNQLMEKTGITNVDLFFALSRALQRLIDPSPYNTDGSKLLETSDQYKLIMNPPSPQEWVLISSNEKLLKLYEYVTTPVEKGLYNRITWTELTSRLHINSRNIDVLVAICGGNVEKVTRHSYALQIIGSRLQLPYDIVSGRVKKWRSQIQQAIVERTKEMNEDQMSNFATELGCSLPFLINLLLVPDNAREKLPDVLKILQAVQSLQKLKNSIAVSQIVNKTGLGLQSVHKAVIDNPNLLGVIELPEPLNTIKIAVQMLRRKQNILTFQEIADEGNISYKQVWNAMTRLGSIRNLYKDEIVSIVAQAIQRLQENHEEISVVQIAKELNLKGDQVRYIMKKHPELIKQLDVPKKIPNTVGKIIKAVEKLRKEDNNKVLTVSNVAYIAHMTSEQVKQTFIDYPEELKGTTLIDKKEETIERIRATVKELQLQSNQARIPITQIARRANVTREQVYYAFETHPDLDTRRNTGHSKNDH